ncbi:hypothetical protein [Streptomyces avermitilis]|uniref:hypothetical protein n=1 Tax=Streptomyces avermitilis TaxID=33903 RepID=UPI00371BC59C
MRRKILKSVLPAALLAAAVSLPAAPASAQPSSLSLTHARIAAHFDFAAGQMPENIALTPNGAADVTFAGSRQVAHLARDGHTRILATLPAPADGGVHTPALGFPLTTGIVRAHDGTRYVLYATGTSDLTGVWRLTPGGSPQRIAALPAASLPNGMALDERTGTLYIADSALGTIWTVPSTGGSPTAWSSAPQLASSGFIGANGIKLHGGAVWVSNLDRGTLLRIPIGPHGDATPVETKATGLTGVDDFAFTGHGNQVLAALNGPNAVVLVNSEGTRSTMLTPADGLQNPSSVAVRGHTVYVLSAAYATATDPNLILASLGHTRP